jgi:regulator of sirC expression with transglutaminase-like and TPR domain
MRENAGGVLPSGTIGKRRVGMGRFCGWGSLLLFGAVTFLVCAFAVTRGVNVKQARAASGWDEFAPTLVWSIRKTAAEKPEPSSKSAFGQFPPSTEAACELERMLRGNEEDIDLPMANWLIAADIPEFREMTREAYFRQLGDVIERVRQEMARMQKVATSRGQNLNDPNTRCGIFCNAIIQLRFAYTERFRQENVSAALMKGLYADPNHICLAGLLRTRRGSCVSMPLIYLVIGERLGMPIHLVAIGKHYFIRWEEPGYRMNIEPTIVDRVSVTPEDSVYLEIEGMTREQLKGSDLRNLTRREVVGNLFFARSGYWATKGPEHVAQQCFDLARGRHLAPDDPGISDSYQAIFNSQGIKPQRTPGEIYAKEKRGNSI